MPIRRSARVLRMIAALFAAPAVAAQDLSTIPDSPAQHAFDFWIGRWHLEVDGRADTTASPFVVTRLPSGAILERWPRASAIRAFDKAWNRWMYAWTSDAGHFQVWEGRRVRDKWYIYREFDIAGDRYLSRQALLPDGPDRVMRVSEKSYDGGVTWELRFREYYRRTG